MFVNVCIGCIVLCALVLGNCDAYSGGGIMIPRCMYVCRTATFPYTERETHSTHPVDFYFLDIAVKNLKTSGSCKQQTETVLIVMHLYTRTSSTCTHVRTYVVHPVHTIHIAYVIQTQDMQYR